MFAQLTKSNFDLVLINYPAELGSYRYKGHKRVHQTFTLVTLIPMESVLAIPNLYLFALFCM
jgi:hypothetical protein